MTECDHHQQYLDKNPGGYCGTGVRLGDLSEWSCPTGLTTSDE
ncbi:hypothetical protein [Sphaerisporangium dianthi]|uniref:Peptide-methionine (S)-S-oxide reductase n=1 Tax=Sphaerisporangium dianthi TaxID=1436120 RepID=A0ABV9CB71_9ACTN